MGQDHIKGKDHNTFLPSNMRAMMEKSAIGFKKTYIDGKFEEVTTVEKANKWIINGGWTIAIAEVLVDVENELVEVNNKVSLASDRYRKSVAALVSSMRNDIASISSSANKTIAEISKLHSAFDGMLKLMNSQDMASSINNAERLAVALKSINDLQSQSITFAVLDKKTA